MQRGLYLFLLLTVLLAGSSLVQAADTNQTVKQAVLNIDQKLATELGMPVWIESAIKAIFRTESEPLTISFIIILVCTLFLFIVLLTKILKLTPFFETTPIAIIGAALIALLIALSGAITSITLFIWHSVRFFNFLETSNAGALGFIVLLLFLFFWITSKVFKWTEEYAKKASADKEGFEEGIYMRFFRDMWKGLRSKF